MYVCMWQIETMLYLPHGEHNIAYYSSKYDEISKVHKLKIWKSCDLYTTQNFSCLKCVSFPCRLKCCIH